MRALPHDFVRSFSDNELSRKMKIRAPWGSCWEVEISKNPRFYFMEKSGWQKFVRDNALGDNEFLTFTHKRKMCFTVNIFKQDGKEMLQPPQSTPFLASSSRIKTEQGGRVDNNVHLGPTTTAEYNGGGKYKRKKKAEESQNSKRTEKDVGVERYFAEFSLGLKKSYLAWSRLRIPKNVVNNLLPEEKIMIKIHHPDGHKSWNVIYLVKGKVKFFSRGWPRLVKEYPLVVGDNCKFRLIKADELILAVSKPLEETH